jgi:prevent-host-death family protein
MLSPIVGIRDAKMHLSKYLKLVQKGTEVIITDRGRPVGRIVPIKTADLPLEDRIKKMENQGMIEKHSRKIRRSIPPPIKLAEGTAQNFLQEDRDNG